MGLIVSSEDQTRFVSTLTALLSPLASPTPEHWFGRITSELKSLLHGETSQVAMVIQGHAYNFSADCPELAQSLDAATTFKRGEMHFHEGVMEDGLELRRHRSLAVFTSSLLDHAVGGGRKQSDFYNDACVPVDALETYGFLIAGPKGEALVGINCGAHPLFDPLSGDTIALLQLLVPALQCGFETLARVGNALNILASTLDGHGVGMLVLDTVTGRELHRNVSLTSLLAASTTSDTIDREMRAFAHSLRGHAMQKSKASENIDWHALGKRTSVDNFRLWGSYLPPGIFGRDAGILITVERSTPALPSAAALREVLGLTIREAQVALRLAVGHSDTTIAHDLGISPHTVRHHVERIFLKLGVHSRKALGFALLTLVRDSRRPDR
jgi:DNA-binding CsgD family transcriptional regulator